MDVGWNDGNQRWFLKQNKKKHIKAIKLKKKIRIFNHQTTTAKSKVNQFFIAYQYSSNDWQNNSSNNTNEIETETDVSQIWKKKKNTHTKPDSLNIHSHSFASQPQPQFMESNAFFSCGCCFYFLLFFLAYRYGYHAIFLWVWDLKIKFAETENRFLWSTILWLSLNRNTSGLIKFNWKIFFFQNLQIKKN